MSKYLKFRRASWIHPNTEKRCTGVILACHYDGGVTLLCLSMEQGGELPWPREVRLTKAQRAAARFVIV